MRQFDSVCVSVFTYKCESSYQQRKNKQRTGLHRDLKLTLNFSINFFFFFFFFFFSISTNFVFFLNFPFKN
jgi:hypothetical protein